MRGTRVLQSITRALAQSSSGCSAVHDFAKATGCCHSLVVPTQQSQLWSGQLQCRSGWFAAAIAAAAVVMQHLAQFKTNLLLHCMRLQVC